MINNTGIFVNKILNAANKYITSPQLYSLKTDDRQDILLGTFMRSWKNFWMEYDTRATPFTRELPRSPKDGKFIFKMSLRSHKENEENTEENEVKVLLKFVFKNSSSFEVKPSIYAPTEELRTKYLYAANKVVDDISLKFSLYYKEPMFIYDLFETLHAHNMTGLTGKEAKWLYKIYNNAVECFPAYRSMPLQKQIELLQAGALQTLRHRRNHRDIHLYAKCCFDEIKAANAANSFIAINPFTREATLYTKRMQHDKGNLSFSEYMYEVVDLSIRTSVHDFDVWNMLCSSSTVRLAEAQ